MTSTADSRSRDFSDRAHRVLFELALHPGGEWVDIVSIYRSLGLNSHQVRSAVNELRAAGMAERNRRFVYDDETGRRTHRTYFRLMDIPSEAAA
ncbi:MarR family transcriptional regulator [Streptomyces sp. NBC_00268]|uniref:MarR family transcriptional regulator n=1 Tax=Streptomyces sp. NBC_00268 TaxID=2975695 RepID=UPI0022509222|nr:MarR family transcriptional regulator [Streptomyces sp. NBC_00268]MCX5182672.1 hypothetical protein [Streptomyces sp. NBC_00268]